MKKTYLTAALLIMPVAYADLKQNLLKLTQSLRTLEQALKSQTVSAPRPSEPDEELTPAQQYWQARRALEDFNYQYKGMSREEMIARAKKDPFFKGEVTNFSSLINWYEDLLEDIGDTKRDVEVGFTQQGKIESARFYDDSRAWLDNQKLLLNINALQNMLEMFTPQGPRYLGPGLLADTIRINRKAILDTYELYLKQARLSGIDPSMIARYQQGMDKIKNAFEDAYKQAQERFEQWDEEATRRENLLKEIGALERQLGAARDARERATVRLTTAPQGQQAEKLKQELAELDRQIEQTEQARQAKLEELSDTINVDLTFFKMQKEFPFLPEELERIHKNIKQYRALGGKLSPAMNDFLEKREQLTRAEMQKIAKGIDARLWLYQEAVEPEDPEERAEVEKEKATLRKDIERLQKLGGDITDEMKKFLRA